MIDFSQLHVMGVLNVTPDSFSDGDPKGTVASFVDRALQMVDEGASIIDVGGESTRPGAKSVTLEIELERVIPVITRLAKETDCLISVDTSKPGVMRAALDRGANIINDVMALRVPGAIEAVCDSNASICLMHMQGEPRSMQENPHYNDVVQEVAEFLNQRVAACIDAGIDRKRLILDPGFGFGKTVEHNLQLIAKLKQLITLTQGPILIGVSRKSTIGAILDAPVDARLAGGIALAVIAAQNGAKIIRTHDVRATVDALKIVRAVQS